MSPYKDREGHWELDFGFKKVYFELEDRLLINIGKKDNPNWISVIIKEIRFNTEDAYLLIDTGLEEEHLELFPCQWIYDARN